MPARRRSQAWAVGVVGRQSQHGQDACLQPLRAQHRRILRAIENQRLVSGTAFQAAGREEHGTDAGAAGPVEAIAQPMQRLFERQRPSVETDAVDDHQRCRGPVAAKAVGQGERDRNPTPAAVALHPVQRRPRIRRVAGRPGPHRNCSVRNTPAPAAASPGARPRWPHGTAPPSAMHWVRHRRRPRRAR